MAVKPIHLWPDPVLSQPCAAVDPGDPDLPALIVDLFDSLYAAKGRGLAAPQIGILKQVFVVDVSWKDGPSDPRVFINPEVTSTSGDVTMVERCLSIPDVPMPVARPERITLRFSDQDGRRHDAALDGALARCVQHEYDHLLGKVIFDHQSLADRTALEAAYA